MYHHEFTRPYVEPKSECEAHKINLAIATLLCGGEPKHIPNYAGGECFGDMLACLLASGWVLDRYGDSFMLRVSPFIEDWPAGEISFLVKTRSNPGIAVADAFRELLKEEACTHRWPTPDGEETEIPTTGTNRLVRCSRCSMTVHRYYRIRDLVFGCQSDDCDYLTFNRGADIADGLCPKCRSLMKYPGAYTQAKAAEVTPDDV